MRMTPGLKQQPFTYSFAEAIPEHGFDGLHPCNVFLRYRFSEDFLSAVPEVFFSMIPVEYMYRFRKNSLSHSIQPFGDVAQKYNCLCRRRAAFRRRYCIGIGPFFVLLNEFRSAIFCSFPNQDIVSQYKS